MPAHKIRAVGRAKDGKEVTVYMETIASQVFCTVPDDSGVEGATAHIPLDELLNQYADEINGNTAALTAITGKLENMKTFAATIPTAWSAAVPYKQTVSVAGMTAAMSPIVDITLPDDADSALAVIEAWGMVGRITTNDGSITVYCYEDKPTTAIPIQIKAVI